MKVLVTGHKGYIGSHLYAKLVGSGADVLGLDLKNGEDIPNCLPNHDFDCVFHMAALPRVGYSVENPSYTLRQNVLVTSKLLEWSRDHGVKRFIFSSSSAVVGSGTGPTSPYGLHKLMSEMECKLYSELYGLDTVCLRYFNAYSADQEYGGAYSTVICAWMEGLCHDNQICLEGDGTQSRDFIHVDDIVDVNLFCMGYPDPFCGETYDVGSGTTLTINEIKDIVLKFNDVKVVFAPERKGDVKHTIANTKKLKKIGWCAKIDPYIGIEKCFHKKRRLK